MASRPERRLLHLRRALILLGALLVAVFACGALVLKTIGDPNEERTHLVFHDQYGEITGGSKFGVAIGDAWPNADRAIRRLFDPGYVNCIEGTEELFMRGGGKFCEVPPARGLASVSYRDETWRNGVITLTVSEGRVVKITWHYPGPFYVDM